MGANIGTTITAQLVAFKLDEIAPLFVFIGAAIVMFAKGKKRKDSVSDASSFREEKIKRENNIFKEGVRGRAGRHFGGREDIESVSRSGSGSRSRSRSGSGSRSRSRSGSGSRALSGDRAESGSRASSGSGSKSRSKSRSSQGSGSEESSEKFSTPQSFHDEDENSI